MQKKRKSENKQRLKSEAEFQNSRVQIGGKKEARTKFYYLVRKARANYRSLLDNIENKKVLVVGSSEGGVTSLARKGAMVTGIDLSNKAIDLLQKAIVREGLKKKCSAMIMDAENLDFDDHSFDIICCSGVLHHLDIKKAMSCWKRVLKPGGRIIMMEPMAWNPVVMMYRLATPSMRTKDEHPLTPKDVRILKTHFGRVEIDSFVFLSVLSIVWVYLPNVLSMKEHSMNALDSFDAWLFKRFPVLKYFCWASVFQLSNPT